MLRLIREFYFVNYVRGKLVDLRSPSSINYFWGFGSILGVILVVQILSGLLLACWYIPDIFLSFYSVEHKMRDLNYGWLLRYLHSNGSSIFFIFIYLHIIRGIFYGSYLSPRISLWGVGVIIYLLLILTAFKGYVLPWGQKSLWGATVITSKKSAVPVVGVNKVEWIWGGFGVGGPTLNRFFVLHFIFPFILIVFVVLHLDILHLFGSSTPLGLNDYSDSVSFHPNFTWKDIVGFILLFYVYVFLVYFNPLELGHSDNYIVANPKVTPPHISPEWYYLFAYAILRAIPDKLLGVLGKLLSILFLFVLSLGVNPILKSSFLNPFNRIFYYIFIFCFIKLTFLGGRLAESPYVIMSQIFSVLYFGFIFLIRIFNNIV